MADRMLFIGWGEVVRGREERASTVFDEVVGFYGRCQQEGRIERLEAVFLDSHAGHLNGYFGLHGSTQQLTELRQDEEFQRRLLDASLVVDDLRIVEGYTNEGVARQMEMWREAIAKVPQTA
jgi:hypothetical protein